VTAKFVLIAAEKADPTSPYPVVKMCAWLRVSTSGFYDYCTAVETDRARRRTKVAEHVKAAHAAGRGCYGVLRVHGVLRRCHDPEVASASVKPVRSVMRELGLSGCQPAPTRPPPGPTRTPPGSRRICCSGLSPPTSPVSS